jgi:hypothetical protein
MPANSNYTEILTSTIEKRRKKVQDNVSKNNALWAYLNKKGNVLSIDGGTKIVEELALSENSNAGAYSGWDELPTAQSDSISAAEYALKQYSVQVLISGLEMLQNSGEAAMLNLMAARLQVAEDSLINILSQGVYGDGTAFSGKAITGLDAAVETTATASQTSTYGGISRTATAGWRSYSEGSITLPTSTTVQAIFNRFWAACTRGTDNPNLIITDNNYWAPYVASLQALQRFTGSDSANLGFPTVKFMNADVVLDGGIGGFAYTNSTTGGTAYFLSTKFLKIRPHKDRNMVPLDPDKRSPFDQDGIMKSIAWAGNLTCSGAKFLGRAFTT